MRISKINAKEQILEAFLEKSLQGKRKAFREKHGKEKLQKKRENKNGRVCIQKG